MGGIILIMLTMRYLPHAFWKVLMVAVVFACEESRKGSEVDEFVVGDSESQFRV